jgi:hypothetical protein
VCGLSICIGVCMHWVVYTQPERNAREKILYGRCGHSSRNSSLFSIGCPGKDAIRW